MIEPISYEPGMTLPDHPVFIAGMPEDVYHAWPDGISSSGLRLIERSPAHWRYAAKREPSRAMELGSAIHAALLEPDRFVREWVCLRDVDDRRASAYKEAAKVHGGDKVLTASESAAVAGLAETVLANPAMASRFLADGWRELSLFVRHPATGVMVRVRYDLLTSAWLAIDLKSTTDSAPDAFSRSIDNYGYDVQAALYTDAFEWATGSRLSGYEFAAFEKEPPHAHRLYAPDVLVMHRGRRRYEAALATFAECERTGHWPLPQCDGPEIIGLPQWAMNAMEEDIQ